MIRNSVEVKSTGAMDRRHQVTTTHELSFPARRTPLRFQDWGANLVSRIFKKSLIQTAITAFALVIGISSQAQSFSVSKETLVYYTGASGTQAKTLKAASVSDVTDYNTDWGRINGVGSQPTFVTPNFNTRNVVVPSYPATGNPSPVTVGESGNSTLGASTYAGDGHTVDSVVELCKGQYVSGSCSGRTLTKGTTVAAGIYTVTTVSESKFLITIHRSDVGNVPGDISNFAVKYTHANTNANVQNPDGGSTRSADGRYHYHLTNASASTDSGLSLSYSACQGDAVEQEACGKTTTTTADDYWTPNGSQRPLLYARSGSLSVGTYSFQYHSVRDASNPLRDTIEYTAIVVNPNVWVTTAATVTVAENTGNAGLAVINAQLANDRTVDGTAANLRAVTYAITKQMAAGKTIRVFQVANSAGSPKLSLRSGAVIDYESTRGQIDLEISASGDHVNGTQKYSLTILVTDVNEPPRRKSANIATKYLLSNASLPSALLLSDYFTDPDGDQLTMRVNGALSHADTGTPAGGGISITAKIVGGTVLSFEKGGSPAAAGRYSYTFSVTASDGSLSSSASSYVINIKVGANTPPVWVGGVSAVTWRIAENARPAAYQPGTASDVDGDVIDYCFVLRSRPDLCVSSQNQFRTAGHLTLSKSTGSIRVTRGFNYELSPNSRPFAIVARDRWGGETPELTVTPVVSNVEEPPYQTKASPHYNMFAGDSRTVDLSTYFVDPESQPLTFRADSLNSNATASLSGSVLTIRARKAGDARVLIQVTDAGGLSAVPATFTGTIKTPGDNTSPNFSGGITSVAYRVDENSKSGTLIGAPLTATDADGDRLTYTVLGLARRFAVSQTSGQISATSGSNLDHETEPTINFILQVTDNFGGYDHVEVTLLVEDVNENPVKLADIPPQSVIVDDTKSIPVDLYFDDEDIIDRGNLFFEPFVVNPLKASATTNRGVITVSGLEIGSTNVVVTAIDHGQLKAVADFELTVVANLPPRLTSPIANQVVVKNIPKIIDLGPVFTDDQTITFAAPVSGSPSTVLATLVGSNKDSLALVGRNVGSTIISITAMDPSGGKTSTSFTVRVNATPTLDAEIADSVITSEQTDTIDLSNHFSDPDAVDTLTYSVAASTDGVVSTSIDGSNLTISAAAVGSTNLTVTATDGYESVSDTFMIRVNDEPMLTMQFMDLLITSEQSVALNLNNYISDSDSEDTLTFSVSVSTPGVVTAAINDSLLSIAAETVGTTSVTVTATDGYESVSGSFMVRVNSAPMLTSAIDDIVINPDGMASIDLSMHFSDMDEVDTLTYSVSASMAGIVSTSIEGSTLTISAASIGTTSITVTATDGLEFASDTFSVRVNAPPMVANPIADVLVHVETPLTVDLSNTFSDADGDMLTLTGSSANTSLATLSINNSNHMLTITGVAPGTVDATITATDDVGASVSDTFTITVKTMPVVAATFPSVSLEVGGDPSTTNMASGFSDADGDVLTYAVSLSTSGVANSSASGSTLTLTAVQKGSTQVTVTASDVDGNSVSQTFSVSVSNDMLVAVANRNLAAFGSAMVGSFQNAIGNRVTTVRTAKSASSFGDFITRFANTSSPNGNVGNMDMQKDVLSLSPIQNRRGSMNTMQHQSLDSMFGLNQTMPLDFSLDLTANADGSGFGIWGGGDVTNYEGAGYDGDASFLHIGADFQTVNCWLFGLAVTRGTGSSEFTYGTADRDMDVSLTAFSPYVRYQPSDEASIWGAVSIGSGEVEIVGGADNATSDLESDLFLIGGRRAISEMGMMKLAIRGDFAAANLSTDSGDAIADGLDVGVNRARGVLEATFSTDESFQPFIDVGIRNDGGDGDTGTGFEVAGGIRIDTDTIDIEARAHTLASHGADDYEENGFSILARVNPASSSGEGFAMELAPRWGATYSNSSMIWNLEQQHRAQHRNLGIEPEEGFALGSRMSYGIAVANDQYLITPFVSYDKRSSSDSSLLLGSEFGYAVKKDMRFRLEGAVGLVESLGKADRVIGISANIDL